MEVEIDYNTCTIQDGSDTYFMQCIGGGSIAVTEENLENILNGFNKDIFLFTINGKLIGTFKNNNSLRQQLRQLPNGLYIVMLEGATERNTLRLIVSH